jgi:hypothetical protein
MAPRTSKFGFLPLALSLLGIICFIYLAHNQKQFFDFCSPTPKLPCKQKPRELRLAGLVLCRSQAAGLRFFACPKMILGQALSAKNLRA